MTCGLEDSDHPITIGPCAGRANSPEDPWAIDLKVKQQMLHDFCTLRVP